MVTITYFTDIMSSWCLYFEPDWKRLENTFGDTLKMRWEIALIPGDALPKTREECEGYYQRSGTITNQEKFLNSGWMDSDIKGEYFAPNLVPLACRRLGASDDRVRLAISEAGLRRGEKVGRWEIASDIAAQCTGFNSNEIQSLAQSASILAEARNSTESFYALGVTQRPTFVIESEIDDRAVFSGLIQYEPLAATIQAMIKDAEAYRAWAARS